MKTKLPEQVGMLRHLHRLAWDDAYPGCPYLLVATLDSTNEVVWVTSLDKGFHKKFSFSKFFDYLAAVTAELGLATTLETKGTWATGPGQINPPRKIIEESTFDQFYIDNFKIVKLFFAMLSAFRTSPKGSITYCMYSQEVDYVVVENFEYNDIIETEKFIREQC